MDSSDPANEIARRHLPTMMNHLRCLVARDAEGTPLASGTGTLVDVDGHKLIITADHVAEQLAADPGEMSLFINPPADVIVTNPFSRLSFRIHPQDRIILPQGTRLDVAAFRAPRDLAAVPHLRWIEASSQLHVVERLRSEYQKDEIPFSLVIIGYPNFARATDPALRTHLFSNFQCWG